MRCRAGDFSQGLLPVTGAPGIVVPMVSLLIAHCAYPAKTHTLPVS